MDVKILMSMCRLNGGSMQFNPTLHGEAYWGTTRINGMYIDETEELVICDRPNNAYDRIAQWCKFDAPTQRMFFNAIHALNARRDKNLFSL